MEKLRHRDHLPTHSLLVLEVEPEPRQPDPAGSRGQGRICVPNPTSMQYTAVYTPTSTAHPPHIRLWSPALTDTPKAESTLPTLRLSA